MKINAHSILSSATSIMKCAKKNPLLFTKEINKIQLKFKTCINQYITGNVRKGVDFTPTYLNMDRDDYKTIGQVSETLHRLLELIFDALASGDKKLQSHFKQHARFFEFLIKEREIWQFYGRYDFLINNKGEFKFCETNTSGGAGFWLNHYYNDISQQAIRALNIANDYSRVAQPYEDFLHFAQTAIKEESKKYPPNLIAILYDDNNLVDKTSQVSSELFMLKSAFELSGREVVIAHVGELTYKNKTLLYRDKKISMTFNKFRLAGLSGSWGANFKQDYAAFLNGLLDCAFFPINGINPLVIGEDKGIFAVLTDPEFHYLFTLEDIEFIKTYVLWTRQLNHPSTLTYAIENKNKLVTKPSNDRRGYGVILGADCSDSEWLTIINDYTKTGAIIQERFDSITIPTVTLANDQLELKQCYQTVSSFMINGKFSGLLSRLSEKYISNISNGGMTQPIRIFDSNRITNCERIEG